MYYDYPLLMMKAWDNCLLVVADIHSPSLVSMVALIFLFTFTYLPRKEQFFFVNYTIHRRHSQHTHTHPYEYTHANPTPRSIFEDCAGKSSSLTKSPQALRCRRERCERVLDIYGCDGSFPTWGTRNQGLHLAGVER
jgi:hypothetical protein